MKFEEEYKRMNENITPKDELKRETAKRMSEESERKTARFRVIRGAAAVAACLAVTVGAMGVLGAFSGKAPAEDQAEGKQPQTVQTDPSGAVLPGPGGTITYSSLGLDLGNVEYPDMPGDSQACLMPFSEDMIMDSKLIIKGTVENVRFNKYFENQTTAVYEVRVDEVLYSEKSSGSAGPGQSRRVRSARAIGGCLRAGMMHRGVWRMSILWGWAGHSLAVRSS
jgi:hypothetical protein